MRRIAIIGLVAVIIAWIPLLWHGVPVSVWIVAVVLRGVLLIRLIAIIPIGILRLAVVPVLLLWLIWVPIVRIHGWVIWWLLCWWWITLLSRLSLLWCDLLIGWLRLHGWLLCRWVRRRLKAGCAQWLCHMLTIARLLALSILWLSVRGRRATYRLLLIGV